MCIPFTSMRSDRVIAYSTVARRLSRLFEEIWRVMLSLNSRTVCMFPLLTFSFRNSHNQKLQAFKSLKWGSHTVGKPFEITPLSPKWARRSAVTCRAMWGGAPPCINTVVSKQCDDINRKWRTVERDCNNLNSWWNTSGELEKCSSQRKKDQE